MTSVDDTKLINDIVDKLKKQGIFDQFRKECLADVDTKPAYQNLTHRVDGFVSNFLANIQWSPDLNKNQLRDQLRRQLTQSQILSSGVERVVDQTVNPKIYKVFKPKVDVIICEYLGIDPQLREEKLKYKAELEHRQIQQEQQQKQQPPQQPPPPGFTSPVHLPMMGQMGTPGTPSFLPPNLMEMNFSYPPPPFGSPNYGSPMGMPQMSNPSQIPGYPNMLNSYPSPWNAMGSPYRPTSISSVGMVPHVPGYGMTTSATISKSPKVTPTKLDPTIMQAIQGQPAAMEEERRRKEREEKEKRKEKEREKLEPLTVESLLNVPVPVPKQESKKERKSEMRASDERNMSKYDDVKKEDIDIKEEVSQHAESSFRDGRSSDVSLSGHESETKQLDEVKAEDGGETKPSKKFHFAWDNLLEQVEDGVSDVTVSSVHTSDLSSFEDEDYSNSEEESAELTAEAVTPTGSPEKQPTLPTSVSPDKAKPRRLIALQYNYSDSDDEETREERKARIAKEKEERYLRRQQRRAELEAKRKERVFEKATEQQQPAEVAPEQQVSGSEAATGPSESEMSSPIKRRGRKTKEELKQQLREQKVLEKKMALRRQRRRNPKFSSEEYVSIFSERKSLMAEDFMDPDEEMVVEEQVMTTDLTSSVDYTHGIVLDDTKSPPTPTQDERSECYSSHDPRQESETPAGRSRRRYRHSEGSRSGSRATTPISDISESSSRPDIAHDGKRRSRRSRNDDYENLETASTRSNDSDRPSQRYNDNDLYKPRTSYGRKRRQSGRSFSPVSRGQSSPHRSRSPGDRSISPRGRAYSPVGRGQSPSQRSRSPSRHRSFSPDDGSRSPIQRSDCRRLSADSRSPSPGPHRRAPSSPHSPEPSMDKEGEQIDRVGGRGSRIQPSPPPPLDEGKLSTQRYDMSDLYKPHKPSTRASRYLSRASPEHKPGPTPQPSVPPTEAGEESDDASNRPRTPVDLVDFGEAAKRNKKPVEKIDFGLAARHSAGVPKLTTPPIKHPSPHVVKHPSPHVVKHPSPHVVKHPLPIPIPIPKHTKYVSNELDFGEAARSVRREGIGPTAVTVPGRSRPFGRGRTGASPSVTETRMSPHGSPRGVAQVKGSVSPKGRGMHGAKGSTHPLVTPGPGRTPRSYHSDRECSQESDHHSWTRQSSNDEEYEPVYEEVAYEGEYAVAKKHRHRSYSREYSYEGKEGSSRDYEEGYEADPPKSSSRRRSMTHAEEGDLEGQSERSMHEYPSPRKSQPRSPRERSNSPEEGEIDGASPEEATPSPEAREIGPPHSPETVPSPPMTRRYNVARQRDDDAYPRHGVDQGSGRGERVPSGRGRAGRPPTQERELRAGPGAASAPMVTRATRRRSEDELMPPSKRLRRYNQN